MTICSLSEYFVNISCTLWKVFSVSWVLRFKVWLCTSVFLMCRHTEVDEHAIQHCFCYTSTVLTSTLAFQKEQKLKVECQVRPTHTFIPCTSAAPAALSGVFIHCLLFLHRRSYKWPRISSRTWVNLFVVVHFCLCPSASERRVENLH